MREISLDTETTGFNPSNGDRIVEIGCIELMNMIPTGRQFHVYINPKRSMPEEAFRVHGLGDEFLKDQPVFSEIYDDFMSFIGNDPLVIHNAPFDMKFLNAEIAKIGGKPLQNKVVDTLTIARRDLPNKQHSLDVLCNYYKVDTSKRDLHGALIDAYLLAQVYLELMGGANYKLDLPVRSKLNVRNLPKMMKPRVQKVSLELPDVDNALLFKPSETELSENKAFRKKIGM